MGALTSSYDEMTLTAPQTQSSTARDVARLAGVSTTTVSRVTNGDSNVSRETRTKVLTAVSQLQYCPNTHATELRRGKGRNSMNHNIHLSPVTVANEGTIARSSKNPRRNHSQTRRSPLSANEAMEVRQVFARLTEDLEKLRSILQRC